jgi:hypothetical protein
MSTVFHLSFRLDRQSIFLQYNRLPGNQPLPVLELKTKIFLRMAK